MLVSARAVRVVVDAGRCCGAGHCAAIVPEVFDQSPDSGVAMVLQADPPRAFDALVEEAADLCPVGAISLTRP